MLHKIISVHQTIETLDKTSHSGGSTENISDLCRSIRYTVLFKTEKDINSKDRN